MNAGVAPPRADVATLAGYHSAQVQARVRLNTNESPYPPPPAFLEALAERVRSVALHRYPDREANAAKRALAGFLGVEPGRLFLGNGSNEVLQALLLAYGGAGRRSLTFEPTYQLHRHISRITGTGAAKRPRGESFVLTPAAVREAVAAEEPDVVFLCSPNNPTGTVDPPGVVEAALEGFSGLVIVDEAYAEFAGRSALPLLPGTQRLALVRTFSKVWSLAGLRLGYVVTDPVVVAELGKVALPYNLSALGQAAIELSVGHTEEMTARVAALVSGRAALEAGLAAQPGVRHWPSGANFVLFRPVADATAVWEALLRRGVLVRNCATWPGLTNCLRVCTGTPEENAFFLAALQEAVDEVGGRDESDDVDR